MKRVAVLMSTYNGEKYIEEQIDSILTQRDVVVTLYIRDDGSKDETVNIINNYILKNQNIVFYKDNVNLGPGRSFLTLLDYVATSQKKFDFYAFSDQDDIWLGNKLIEAIKLIDTCNQPTLYCSNQLIYENGKILGLRFGEKPVLMLKKQITTNLLYGCTFVFNSLLANELVNCGLSKKSSIDSANHDGWVVLVAMLIGKIVYDQNAYIKYRIHTGNLVGLKSFTFQERLLRIINEYSCRKNLRMNRAIALRAMFDSRLRQEDKIIIDKFADYKNSLRNRLKLMFDKSVTSVTGENHFLFIMKVLIGFV